MKMSKQFLTTRTSLSWPPGSPDMSPIETLWAIIKAKLRAITFSSKPQLINALLNICCRDNEVHPLLNEACKKLIDGMRQGLKLCTMSRARIQNFNFICNYYVVNVFHFINKCVLFN